MPISSRTAAEDGLPALRKSNEACAPDDRLALLDQLTEKSELQHLTCLDRYSDTPEGHIAFLEFVCDEVRDAVAAKRGGGYGNATLASMVGGIHWREAHLRLVSLSGLPPDAVERVASVLRRQLTVGTVERIDELLRPAIVALRDTWEDSRDNPSGTSSLEKIVFHSTSPVRAAPPRPDILLVTVNEHETKAVHDAFLAATGAEGAPVPLEGRLYHDLGEINGTSVYHAISEIGSGGTGGMQQTVEKAISALEPGAIIAVGIAFGVNEEKQKIGEILVSKLLRLYELQRVGKRSKITLRGARPDASPRLMSHFRTFQQVKWTGAKVRFGVVLTGEKLVDDVDYRDQLVKLEVEAEGGEMEGAGLYASSYANKVDWIVIKSICDWADGNKEVDKEPRQKLAAKNAAAFVVESLRYAPLKLSKIQQAIPSNP